MVIETEAVATQVNAKDEEEEPRGFFGRKKKKKKEKEAKQAAPVSVEELADVAKEAGEDEGSQQAAFRSLLASVFGINKKLEDHITEEELAKQVAEAEAIQQQVLEQITVSSSAL